MEAETEKLMPTEKAIHEAAHQVISSLLLGEDRYIPPAYAANRIIVCLLSGTVAQLLWCKSQGGMLQAFGHCVEDMDTVLAWVKGSRKRSIGEAFIEEDLRILGQVTATLLSEPEIWQEVLRVAEIKLQGNLTRH